ncbi:MAG: hypothetical protein JRN35_04865 [Nitrososphaerota archaeon]|nr:hypothetical protein [Nitrososphaerota archaeon]
MPRQDEWTVLKACTTSWMYTSIPYEVAQLIGAREDVIEKLPPHLRTLAFLDRGPGRLRIVPSYNSQELLQKEMYGVVSLCKINPHLAIRITEKAAKHLELDVRRKGNGGFECFDPIAFVAPLQEYRGYVDAASKGTVYEPREVGHVYLTKASFKGKWAWPTVDEVESKGR